VGRVNGVDVDARRLGGPYKACLIGWRHTTRVWVYACYKRQLRSLAITGSNLTGVDTLSATDIGAALFGAPAPGTAWRDLPTPADEEADVVSLDHVPGVTLDRDADYITLSPWRSARPATASHDDDGDDA